ncbi:MAG: DUF4838 domain-containing protein [Victivallales bacterium]|nr:DUF4838 domain-containing protein [Victivallales bacterium]
MMTLLGAEPLELAENGKTAYSLVVPKISNSVEQAAVRDLKVFLQQITGAVFPEQGSGPKIYIAKKPDNDTSPFSARERRICSVGDDIYLYGEGEYGAAFAIYDFLEKKLGCRWFGIFGVMTIPKKQKICLEPFKERIVPSFEVVEAGLCPVALRGPVYDFFRRNRMYIRPRFTYAERDDAWQYIGPTCHSLGYYVPAGDIKGVRKGGRMGPSPILKDKKYFKTNPEYFTLTEAGKRVPDRHYCFSNPGLRKVMTENIEKVLTKEYTPGRKAVMKLDINDVNGPLCSCKDCQKLVEKYNASGGPFFDYLLEMAPYFARKYPDVLFRFIAYGESMTLNAPELKGKVFPPNIRPGVSGLTHDVSKPYDSATNKRFLDNLISWKQVSSSIAGALTPVHWSYPSGVMSLAAGIERLIKNMRIMYRNKVRSVSAHYSEGVIDTYNFKELQLYLLGRLGENVNADAEKLIREFCDAYYGAASKDMAAYIRELDAAAAKDPHYYRWNSSPLVLSYVTPKNIMRWQKQFDLMTAKVKNDPEASYHVANARMDLDQNTVYIWKEIIAEYPGMKGKLSMIADRYRKAFREDAEKRLKTFGKEGRLWTVGQIKRSFARGIDLAEKKGRAKPLPKNFTGFLPGTVYEAFPEVENGVPLEDPEAAAGLAIELPGKKGVKRLAYQDRGVGGSVVPNMTGFKWSSALLSHKPPYHQDNLSAISPNKKYKIYYLGRAKLTYDCSVFFRGLSQPSKKTAAFAFGRAVDPEKPDALYDFYISMKYMGDNLVRIDRMVSVKVQKGSREAGIDLNRKN